MNGKDQKPTAAQKRLQARRLHIVGAAVACFIEKGYHQTGVRDIATAADVSLGNLYNHFKNKDEILFEITRIEAQELAVFLKMLHRKDAPQKVLYRFFKAYLAYCAARENALLSLEILSVAIRNPLILAGFEENRNALVFALSTVLQAGIFEKTTDKDEPAKLILDMIEGLALRSVMAGKPPSKAAKVTLWQMIEKAVLAPPKSIS